MCVPVFHVGGLLGLLVNLTGGHTTVIQPRFDAGGWLDLVERHRVQSSFVVPTMLHRILEHPRFASADLSSLASLSSGAAAMPPELLDRALEALPHVGFSNTFGQTETIGGITMLGPEDHRHPVRRRSVGRPLPGVEIRIEPEGAEGELWARYAGQAEWRHTGDVVRQDADGYLYVLGRLSDTINRGGEKFGPAEIEATLRSHPAVADVAVVGVPDAEMGERVGAVVVASPGVGVDLDQLRSWCDGRLAEFKRPELLAVVDALPLNDVGKVDRRALLALLAVG
jgi:long-chain acyl-CoA synthetase